MRVVSPLRGGGTKRERENDGEPTSRRVSRARTESHHRLVFVPAMITIIKKLNESDSPLVLSRAMTQLVRLLYEKDGESRHSMQECFFNSGGQLAVVTCMLKHPHNRHLQHEAIRALTNATCNNTRNKIVIAEIGGIQATVQAMRNHASDKETQRLCFKALNNLIHKKYHAGLFVQELGGTFLIIHAMNEFAGDANVIQKAVVVLAKLCWTKNLRPMLQEANVGGALTLALEKHASDEKIQKYAREALEKLSLL